MASIRTLLALWAGKANIRLSRLTGHGGTSFPGNLSRRIAPDILAHLARQPKKGILCVTGTNGKTTTTKMISAVFEAVGKSVAHNRAGANLIGGITTAFIQAASFGGSIDADLGLAEVDEATMPQAVKELNPRTVVVTNFFRDQLDRFGELDKTVQLVRESIAALDPATVVLLNADDPLVAGLALDLPQKVLYYGIDDPQAGSAAMAQTAESKYCPRCGEELRYDRYYYGQLGHYHCPRCPFRRPETSVSITSLELLGEKGSRFTLRASQGGTSIHLPIPGFYNLYNALAAIAAGLRHQIPLAAVKAGLEKFQTGFGRMELIDLGDRRIFVALIKNPVGCDEVLRTITANDQPKRLLVIINDNAADGRDISWLWDADFETLTKGESHLRSLAVSGLRAEDMAVRLKYTGLDISRLTIAKAVDQAIEEQIAATGPGETLYILPTYTALLESKGVLQKLGYSPKYWEE